MDQVTVVPMVTIHPDRVNIYNEVVRHVPRSVARVEKIKMPKSNFHNNKISDQARRKINKALDYLLFMAGDKQLPGTTHGKNFNFKISFITLTLSSNQTHSDNEIKSLLLNQFFVEAKKKWNVDNYIWRAEKQKNNNIHFHILTDRFIPWNELRNTWNRIQNKLGYVDRYRSQMLEYHKGGFKVRTNLLERWSYKAQIKAYKAGVANDWHSPNSTDVHSIKFVNNIKAYISKYVTKDEKYSEINGRMWGCNYNLTSIPGAKIVVDSFICDELRNAFRKVKPKFYVGKYFSVVFITPAQLAGAGCFDVINEFAKFLLEKFNYHFSLYMLEPG